MIKPEILAPAGSFEALTAAVRSGADAVYFGTGNFNARRNASNFWGTICSARWIFATKEMLKFI